jgi:hypothetical protein
MAKRANIHRAHNRKKAASKFAAAEMDAKIKVTEAMRDCARGLEDSQNPDVVIAAAEWEKRCIEELERLQKIQRREAAKASQ